MTESPGESMRNVFVSEVTPASSRLGAVGCVWPFLKEDTPGTVERWNVARREKELLDPGDQNAK